MRAPFLLTTAPHRIVAGLRRWPDAGGWRQTALIAALYALSAWGLGFATGLYQWAPRLDLDMARAALIALVLPALGEELVFRGALIPTKAEAPRARAEIALALAVFLAWHPLNAALFFPSVLPLFADWRFLAVTAMLGLACSHLWRATGSLWPAVALHWLAVVVWKALLGAPRMM